MSYYFTQFILVILVLNFFGTNIDAQETVKTEVKSPSDTSKELIDKYILRLKLNPKDDLTRYELANEYLKLKHINQAKAQLMKLIQISPNYYYAYHQLTYVGLSNQELENIINKLNSIKPPKNEMFLHSVALSEMYEKQNKYYLAARVLVNASFANVVPQKFLNSTNIRIKALLAKAKGANEEQFIAPGDEDLDNLPIENNSSVDKVDDSLILKNKKTSKNLINFIG